MITKILKYVKEKSQRANVRWHKFLRLIRFLNQSRQHGEKAVHRLFNVKNERI